MAAIIDDADILDEHARIPAPFGSFRPPKAIDAKIPRVPGRDSCCLIDFVARVVEKGPTYVIFCAKSGVSKGPGGWELMYSENCEVVKVSDVDPRITKAKDRAREECEGKESEAIGTGKRSSSITEQVDDTFSPGKCVNASSTDEVSETETVLEGEVDCPSDDEYVRALRFSNLAETDAIREMITRDPFVPSDLVCSACVGTLFIILMYLVFCWAHEQSRVDLTRYVVRVAPEKGVVTLRWRWDEKDLNNEKFTDIAGRISRKESNRAFTLSCSGSLSRSTPEEIAQNCVTWYNWHRCWMYDCIWDT